MLVTYSPFEGHGSAEMLTAGLLNPMSSGLDVSAVAAGSLFSAYALGVAIGGPPLTAATIRRDRPPVLVGSMAAFAALVLAPAVLPHFGWFVATQLGAGALQGFPGRGLPCRHHGRPSRACRPSVGGRHRRVLDRDRAWSPAGRTGRNPPRLGGLCRQRARHRSVPRGEPCGSPRRIVASLPASAASAGIALGSVASGFAYTAVGPPAVILTGTTIALTALALALTTRGLRSP